MQSTQSIIKKLKTDFPQFTFQPATQFLWSSVSNTIYFDSELKHSEAFTLHELSHALLGHKGYERDIELLKLERDAWEYAGSTLAPSYSLSINDDIIQENLDTYRIWLHARSTCPGCEAIGLQAKDHLYHCVACNESWWVNEARLCNLRRYTLQTK